MKKSTIKKFAAKLMLGLSVATASLLSAHAQMMPRCNAHFYYATDSAANSLQFLAANNGPGASYAWDFGDGSTGSNGYTSHTYSAPGTYYVCLTVTRTDSAGTQICFDTECDSVHVMVPPPPPGPHCDAHFGFRQQRGTMNANFVGDLNAPGTVYSWYFGDGSTGSGMNATHTYSAAGAYYVCLSLSLTDSMGTVLCSDNRCDSIYVQSPPPPAPTCNAHFFYNAPCDSLANVILVGMRNFPNASYSWDMGDGSTDTGRVARHTYASAGVYYVCLTVTTSDSLGNQLCTDTWCDSVRTVRPRHHNRGHMGGGHNGHRTSSIGGSFSVEPTAVFFPNPMTEKSVLHLENFEGAVSVKVMDQSGRLIKESTESNGDISFEKASLNPGMYYYVVTSGDQSVQGKFMIQ